MSDENALPAAPIRETLSGHFPAILAGTLTSIAFFVLFYVTTAFSLGYATATMGIARNAVLQIQLLAICALAAGIFAAGWIADKSGPVRAMLLSGVIGIPASFAFAPLFGSGEASSMLIALALLLFVMGLSYGTAGGWLPSLFPARVRYTGTSIAFNAAGVFGGAVAPYGAQWLAGQGGLSWVGYYLAASCLFSLLALMLIPKTAPTLSTDEG
jgi:MFS family permease